MKQSLKPLPKLFRLVPFKMEHGRKRNSTFSAEDVIERSEASCFPSCGRNPMSRIKRPTHNVDVLMAKEMNELSLEERERVFEDIHGIPRVVEEEPDFVAESLVGLDQEICKIKKKRAYNRAVFLSPKYVKDRKLMFLRSECFETRKAAVRLVSYFERKLDLFGIEKLVKCIELDDLDNDDQHALMSGSIQFLPSKDRTGRSIIFNAQKYQRYNHWTNQIRILWYLVMSNLINNEEAQRKGLVLIVYNVGTFRMDEIDSDLMTHGINCSASLPMRCVAVHYCFNDPRLLPVSCLFRLFLTKNARLRFRVHSGSYLEIQYELAAFGIPRNILPVNDDGDLVLTAEIFKLIIEKRKVTELESARSTNGQHTTHIEYPSEFDVLLGRGRPYQEYTGNLHLASVIDTNRSRYRAGGRGQKTLISYEIVGMVKEAGARFLKRDSSSGDEWVEVSDEVAREKVGHIFRMKTKRGAATCYYSSSSKNEMKPHRDQGLG